MKVRVIKITRRNGSFEFRPQYKMSFFGRWKNIMVWKENEMKDFDKMAQRARVFMQEHKKFCSEIRANEIVKTEVVL